MLTATVILSILCGVAPRIHYDITELARLSGLTVRTIRYYLQQRLLPSSGLRGPGARYDAGHLARLQLIRRLQAEHLPLAEIRRRLEAGATTQGRHAPVGRPRVVPPATDPGGRSHWERITLGPDIELHVRRPLSRADNRGVERLLEEARRVLGAPADPPRAATAAGSIVLLPEPDLRSLAEAVVPRLAASDPALFASLAMGPDLAPSPGGETLSPVSEQALARDSARRAPAAAVRVALTRRRLADNWFSHWHAESRAAVVSLADWDGFLQVSPVAFVAYETAHHGLRSIAPDFDPVRLAHEETRGCLFDFCATRADIEVKLQAADLCPECRRALEDAGLPLDRLLHLAETIRTLATDPPTAVQ
jgi:DNA-binding transcriptional MerR regulator